MPALLSRRCARPDSEFRQSRAGGPRRRETQRGRGGPARCASIPSQVRSHTVCAAGSGPGRQDRLASQGSPPLS